MQIKSMKYHLTTIRMAIIPTTKKRKKEKKQERERKKKLLSIIMNYLPLKKGTQPILVKLWRKGDPHTLLVDSTLG